MKREINDEGKEIKPIMFPRLHVKDAEKGGPKAPPRNKMALYDKLTIPSSQTLHSASGSPPSFFSLPLRNYSSRPSSSRHPNDLIHCENSLKIVDGEDALEARDSSSRGRNSFYSINLNNNDEEDKLKSQKPFRKKENISGSIELKSNQYGKNQIEEHTEVSRMCQKPMKFRNLEEMKIGHTYFKEEIRNMSGNSSKTLQGSNCQTHEDDATLGDKINLKRDRHIYRHYDIPNKPISDSTLGMGISPDDAIKIIGVKKFWKARNTIIKSFSALVDVLLFSEFSPLLGSDINIAIFSQRRLFLLQVFELHRLIQVQRLIAKSPHLLLEHKLLLTRPSLEVPALKKLQSETMAEQPSSSIAKLNSTFMKPDTEHAENSNTLGKIPLLSVNNVSKNPIIQLPNYGHHSGNQWLIPIMSPSEGLVYKPFIGPCPPNAGFTAPPVVHGDNNNDASLDEAHAVPASHQGINFLSDTPLPQLFPPCDMMPTHEQHMNPFGNTMLYQSSSCNMSNHTSHTVSNSRDLQLQSNNTGCNPSSKRMMNEEDDACCLIPLASSSLADKNSSKDVVVEHEPVRTRVIKAKPYNSKSASESAARIFRSIQEERKRL